MGERVDVGVFISYRRDQAGPMAGRLSDRLVERFGEGRIFMDVESIQPGVDFVEAIEAAVASCGVLLAVIGPHWLEACDQTGGRRLDDPDDLVRREVEAALSRGIRVIPVLVEDAAMPRRQDLPDSLAGLARRNAFRVRHETFRGDVSRLLQAIEPVLGGAAARPPSALTSATDRRGEDPENEPTQGPTTLHLLDTTIPMGRSVAFSPNGHLLATAGLDRKVRLWHVASGEERNRAIAHEDEDLNGVEFSPHGRLLATCGDQTARLWDVVTGREHARLGHPHPVLGVAFSSDGRLLATGSIDGIRVWDITNDHEVTRVDWYAVMAVSFSPDGTFLAGATANGVQLWSSTGLDLGVLPQRGHGRDVAFAPDGGLLAGIDSGSSDEMPDHPVTAQIWDTRSRQERVAINVEGSTGCSVAFSPNGRLLATAAYDTHATIWDLAGQGQGVLRSDPLDGMPESATFANAVAFSPDGHLMATGGAPARIWSLDPMTP